MTDLHGLDEAQHLVAAHTRADARIHSLHDTLGEVAAAIVRLHPKPGTILPIQIDTLFERLEMTADSENQDRYGTHNLSFAFGDLLASVNVTTVSLTEPSSRKVAGFTVVKAYSARIPGLHDLLPPDEGASDRAKGAILSALAERGHAALGAGLVVERPAKSSIRGHMVILPTPEDPERTQHIPMPFGHASDRATAALASQVADAVIGRWRRRHEIRAVLDQVVTEAREIARDVPEMEIVAATVSYYSKPGTQKDYDMNVHVRMLGNGLRHEIKNAHWSLKDPTRFQMNLRIKEHRKRLKAREERRVNNDQMGTEAPELGIAPVLAAMIMVCDPRHAAGILDEIEAGIAGRSSRPANPRQRGITDINVRDGRVNANVDVTPEIRYERDRITFKTVPSVPETLLNGIKGIDMRRLADHPALAGLTAKSATISTRKQTVTRKDGTRGIESVPCLKIRCQEQSVPLAPVLAHLRYVVAEEAARTGGADTKPTRRRTKRSGDRP